MTRIINAGWLAVVCWLFTINVSQAQDTNAPRTELGLFEAATNVVIIKGTDDLGAVATDGGKVEVVCKESIDTSSGNKQHGLALTVTTFASTGFAGSDTSIIDYDEMDNLLNALNYLKTVNWSVSALPNFSAVYMTKDEFRMAVYSSRRQPDRIGISLQSSHLTTIRVSLTTDQFAQFRGLIQQAKTKLDALHGK